MWQRLFFILTFIISLGAGAQTPELSSTLKPEQYITEGLQKDLPRSLRWFAQILWASNLDQAAIHRLYENALPFPQENQQRGISLRDSLERMILMLEGARYFEQIQSGSMDYQNQKERVIWILQATKDQMDRFQFGEDPQVLAEEWQVLGVHDLLNLTTDLVEVFVETERLLKLPIESAPADSFEEQRFSSYMQSFESFVIAPECQEAQQWRTEQAESCQNDDTLECDRRFARECKKLQ